MHRFRKEKWGPDLASKAARAEVKKQKEKRKMSGYRVNSIKISMIKQGRPSFFHHSGGMVWPRRVRFNDAGGRGRWGTVSI